jgi:hypothetical protein
MKPVQHEVLHSLLAMPVSMHEVLLLIAEVFIIDSLFHLGLHSIIFLQ